MPVIPPWPPVLAPRANSSTEPFSNDAAKHEHQAIIVVSVFVAVLALILVFRFWFTPWYHNRQAAKAAREQTLFDQRLWYKSTRPIPRQPSISTRPVDLHALSASSVRAINQVQYPILARVDPTREPVDAECATPTVSHFATQDSSTASLTLSQSDSTISVVSGLPPATDSKPFPAFDSDYLPDPLPTIDDFPHVRDSCQTIDSFASIGVAVPMKLPASSSPSEVHNGRREYIETGNNNPIVLGGDDDVSVRDHNSAGWNNCTY